MNVNVGEKFVFKKNVGRGRPFIGEVVKKAGMFTYMKVKNGDVIPVQTKMILHAYEFKPYNTKKRQAEAA